MNDEKDKINGQGDAENIETNTNETAEPQAASEQADEMETKGSKKFGAGKHNHKLDAALEAAERERDDFKDKYLRTFSDFNNYKKRNLTAAAVANRDGQAEVIAKILPVLDNFERALEQMDEQCDDGFVKGMFMVYRQLSCVTEAFGVKEIEAKCAAFDPNLHQAISLEEVEGQEAGIVVNVLQKGYMMDDKVLRHSIVTVSK